MHIWQLLMWKNSKQRKFHFQAYKKQNILQAPIPMKLGCCAIWKWNHNTIISKSFSTNIQLNTLQRQQINVQKNTPPDPPQILTHFEFDASKTYQKSWDRSMFTTVLHHCVWELWTVLKLCGWNYFPFLPDGHLQLLNSRGRGRCCNWVFRGCHLLYPIMNFHTTFAFTNEMFQTDILWADLNFPSLLLHLSSCSDVISL